MKVLAGIGVLLALTIFAGVTAAIFDPELESLGAKLYVQAVLAASMIGVAFVAAGERGQLLSDHGLDAAGIAAAVRSAVEE